jgi:hypothetical protein
MSDLLNSASLVMIPSGYKEDVVYSQIPTDGSGDLSFTRASNGTRINSAGLVEDVPWNLLEQSNSFNTTWAIGTNTTLTAGFSDPFGGGNAWRLTMTSGSGTFLQQTFTFDAVPYNLSVWAKANGNTNLTLQISGSSQESYVLTNEWQRITFTYTPTAGASQVIIGNGNLSVDALIYGAQLNIGSTAKPYFPTTDRLNVPRLTYQNGGGGCPSLLLEPQRTNLVTYSEQFDNASWAKTAGVVVTANAEISPDGTQNADLIQYSGASQEIYQNISSTTGGVASIYIKGTLNQTIKFGVVGDESIYTLTGEWQRLTKVFTVTTTRIVINTYSGATARNIYLWGAQLEAGSYPTSYIPTTSSSATRVADACSKTGISSLIGQSEGVLFLDFKALAQDSESKRLTLSDGTLANRITLATNDNVISGFINVGNVNEYSFYESGINVTNNTKVAVKYAQNNFAIFINGVKYDQSTSGNTFASGTLTKISFDNALASNNMIGNINQVLLFPTALSDAELQALTTL